MFDALDTDADGRIGIQEFQALVNVPKAWSLFIYILGIDMFRAHHAFRRDRQRRVRNRVFAFEAGCHCS